MNPEQKNVPSLIKRVEYVVLALCLALTGALYVGDATAHAQTQTFGAAGGANNPAPTFTGLPGECGTGKINLVWSGVSSATSYQLYRDGTSNKIFENLATSFTDIGLIAGSQHTYYLITLGGLDTTPRSISVGAPSACTAPTGAASSTSGTDTSIGLPSTPTNLTATLNTPQGGILLTWNNASVGQSYITILRRVNGGSLSTLQTISSTGNTYVDSLIAPSSTYQYQLRVCNQNGCSGNSNIASASTPTPPVGTNTNVQAAPTSTSTTDPNLLAPPVSATTTTSAQEPFGATARPGTACSSNYVVLTWTRASDTTTTYDIYRNNARILSTPNLYFNDASLSPDTLYQYKINALHSGTVLAYTMTSARTAKKCDETIAPVITDAPPSSVTEPREPMVLPAPTPVVPSTSNVSPPPRTAPNSPSSNQPLAVPTDGTDNRPVVVAAPPTAFVISMQNIAETVTAAQSALGDTRDGLVRSVDSHVSNILQGSDAKHRTQIEGPINAIRESLVVYIDSTLGGISNATPDQLSKLQDRINAGLRQIDTIAGTAAVTQQPNERDAMSALISALSSTIVNASAALQTTGGDQLYKDTNKDGISDYDSVHIYHIDPVTPSPVTVVGTSTLTAGQKVLLGYDPTASELVKVTPQEPKVSLAPETPIYAVKEVSLNTEKKVTIKGTALPNSYVTVYVYSTPIIVTIKTDNAGKWEYTVDKELETGAHTIYAATVDNTGAIVARSVAIPFTQTAEAATLDQVPLGATTTEKPSLFNNPAVVPLFLISILFIIGVLYIMGRNQAGKNVPPASPLP